MSTTAVATAVTDHPIVIVGASGIVGRRVGRLLAGTVPFVERSWPMDDRATHPGPTDDGGADIGEPGAGGGAAGTVPVEEVAPGQVVVLACGGPHAPLAARLAAVGASVVSVSDALADVRELVELDDRFRDADATLVAGAAMAPGLSGLLVQYLASRLHRCEEIHVAAHATAGPQCARQHHRALAGRAVGWHDGTWIERPAGSGRELCWFPEPVGAHDCYRAELPEPLLLHRTHPDVLRISARVSATRRDRLTARLPMLRPPHPEGGVGALRVEVRGAAADGARQVLVAGVAEFIGAAAGATTAVLAHAAHGGELPTGLVLTSDPALDTVDLLARVRARGVRLQEFTGVPRHG